MKSANVSHNLTPAEEVVFSAILGLLWTWMVIQETDLADRQDTLAIVLGGLILAASGGLWWGWIRYGLSFFSGER